MEKWHPAHGAESTAQPSGPTRASAPSGCAHQNGQPGA
jgi:hypothetical protein